MNIGIDVRKLRDYGIGTHIRNVILYAAARDPSNRYVLFCEPADFQNAKDNFVWVSDNSQKYSLAEHFNLAKKASEQKLDLFHAPHYTLPLRLKEKAVVTIHDLTHLKLRHLFPLWKVKAAEFVIGKAIRKAETIIAVSETTKEDILNFFPAAGGKVQVLYNRLSEEWISSGDQYPMALLGLTRDYLLYVGNFKKHKGIATLIEAYQRLKDPPSLVLVGKSAAMDPEISDLVFSDSRIRVFGFMGNKLLRSLYSNALLFIFPSLYEGFGYPPVEAMSCGAPVLSSDAPALKEVLHDAAEYFERGNSEDLSHRLKVLIEDSSKRAKLKEAGQKRASRFMTEDSPKKLLEIYKRFVS
jgi:glycosyltransferase involved in cell wall biosynthesis